MRVAILVPPRSPANADLIDTVTELPELLAGGGGTASGTAVLINLPEGLRPDAGDSAQETSALGLAAAAELAKQLAGLEAFDLVHVVGAPEVMPFIELSGVPAVASIIGRPVGSALSAYESRKGRVVMVADSEGNRAPSLDYERVIGPGPGAKLDYVGLYDSLSTRMARESHRPWGYYVILADEPDHKVKRIVVLPGQRLSLQRHKLRSEHWHVIEGEAVVTRDEERIVLTPGEAVDIPTGAAHRVANESSAEMAFIEVQRGEYFGEDDIERLEDDYDRT